MQCQKVKRTKITFSVKEIKGKYIVDSNELSLINMEPCIVSNGKAYIYDNDWNEIESNNIVKVYKGNEELKTITIKRPGGQYDGREYNLEDATVISQGETYLFLAKTFANSYPSLLNVSQASYDLNGQEKLSIEENTITLSQILEVLEQ